MTSTVLASSGVHPPKTKFCTPDNDDSQQKFRALKSAPPPRDTLVLYFLIVCIALFNLPSLNKIDSAARAATFSGSAIGLSATTVALIRAIYSLIIWGTSLACMLGPGWEILPPYAPNSRLRRNVPLRAVGWRTMWPFTSWYDAISARSPFLDLDTNAGKTHNISPSRPGPGICWEFTFPSLLILLLLHRTRPSFYAWLW